MADYVQGGMFGGLTFAPLDFNPTFGPTPAAPSFPALPTFPGAPAFPGNSLSTVAPSISTGIPGTTPASNVPAGSTTGTPAPVASTTTPETVWSSYLVRGVIIVLGFIFVAVGLTMFSTGSSAVQAVKKITPGV